MANSAPATVTITSTTGPGVTVTAQRFTDVVNLSINFSANTLRIQRSGANAIQYYDYSAMATGTLTIANGLSTLVFSV